MRRGRRRTAPSVSEDSASMAAIPVRAVPHASKSAVEKGAIEAHSIAKLKHCATNVMFTLHTNKSS